MLLQERLLIISDEQNRVITDNTDAVMGDLPFVDIKDSKERVAVLGELNDEFNVAYGYQSETRQQVIDEITDVHAHSALRAVMPPNRRNTSVGRGLAVGTVHRGLVERSKNFSVRSRSIGESLLLNADVTETSVKLTQSAARGSISLEGVRYTFGNLGPLIDVSLTREQRMVAMRIVPLANLAIFASVHTEHEKQQSMETITSLIALMATGTNS